MHADWGLNALNGNIYVCFNQFSYFNALMSRVVMLTKPDENGEKSRVMVMMNQKEFTQDINKCISTFSEPIYANNIKLFAKNVC